MGEGLRSFGRGLELRALRADGAQPLAKACPRPRLDLFVARFGLSPRRLEVLEPGVGLLDQQELLGFTCRCHGGMVGPPSDGTRPCPPFPVHAPPPPPPARTPLPPPPPRPPTPPP